MRRDLLSRLYDWDAGTACDEPIPGASARGCYASLNEFGQIDNRGVDA